MRGPTANERRADRIQALTFLGLLADDVNLAAIHYPEFGENERRALTELATFAEPDASVDRRSPIRRQKSISDPTELLQQAAAIAQNDSGANAATLSLDFLRAPIEKMLARLAKDSDVTVVLRFAETLSRVTLAMTDSAASEKGPQDWMPTASNFSAAL